MADTLSPFQRELLEAFFLRAPAFYLTGGAALAGFYLGHRRTEDLDLFTTEDALDSGERALQEAADALGASVERLQTSPDFRRRLVRRSGESLVVDLVRERVTAGQRAKLQRGTVRLDSTEEVLPDAMQKDGGLTPAQLAWVLSELRIGDDARIPGNMSAAELRTALESLIHRLTRLAAPPSGK
jgi:hypothetical protein